MKAATAIRKFIGTPGHNPDMDYPAAKMSEIVEFKGSCTPEEWQEYGKQSCEALGETFEPAAETA